MGERRLTFVTATTQKTEVGCSVEHVAELGESEDQPRSGLSTLLGLVREGDRAATAELIRKYGPRIRRRVRGKLPADMRRVFDSQDILSTVARRLDFLVALGKLKAVSDGQVWSLVDRIAHNSVVEKARAFRSIQSREGGAAEDRMRQTEEGEQEKDGDDLDWALDSAGDKVDREILSLWLKGNQPATIAAAVSMPAATVRKRWERIRGRLKLAYLSEDEM